MKITRVGIAGINTFRCPVCKAAKLGGVLFVKVGMRDYAKMRVDGTVTKRVECNNPIKHHEVEVTLERPKGSASILAD